MCRTRSAVFLSLLQESLLATLSGTLTHFLAERPDGVISVGAARAAVEPGAEVAISGLIGGALEPFVDGYAAFVLADPAILFCNEMPDEHCATPGLPAAKTPTN